MSSTRIVNIRMPEELLDQLDRFVAEGERSAFIVRAIEEQLRKERLLAAVQGMAGFISEEEAPYWSTPEQVSDWVLAQRKIGAEKGLADIDRLST